MAAARMTAKEVERLMAARRVRGWLRRAAAQRADDVTMELDEDMEMECLDLLEVAQDGDTITIPRGRHYRRLTALTADVTPYQDFLCVRDTRHVHVGYVVSVRGEEMEVKSKTKTRLVVRRRSPAPLLAACIHEIVRRRTLYKGCVCIHCSHDTFAEHHSGPAPVCPSCLRSQPTYIDKMESGSVGSGLSEMYDAVVDGAHQRDRQTDRDRERQGERPRETGRD